jgi:hypothetical protein
LTFEWLAEVKVISIVRAHKGACWKIDQTIRDEVIQELFNPTLNFGGDQRTESSRTASQLSEERDEVEPLPEVNKKRKTDVEVEVPKRRKASVVQRDLAVL